MSSPHAGHPLVQSLIGLAGMLVCVLAGLLLHIGLGGQGRNPAAGAAFSALLMAGLAAWLCARCSYRLLALWLSLVLALLLGAAAIGHFGYGGLPRLDRFFLSWMGGIALWLALPWLLGMGLGLFWRMALMRRR